MTITIEIPDDLAGLIVPEGQDPARRALEDMAVEAYRGHRLTGAQLGRVLGIVSFDDLDAFLKERGIWLDYTVNDFRREGGFTARVMAERQRELERRIRNGSLRPAGRR